MIYWNIVRRLLLRYWYFPLLLLLLMLALSSTGRDFLRSRTLSLVSTPVDVESVQQMSEIITATYFGESLGSLYEAYEGLEEGDLFGHYQRLRKQCIAGQKGARGTYDQLLQEISGVHDQRQFESLVKITPWGVFAKEHASALAAAKSRYAHRQAHREALVYMGRGTVQAGFDLGTLTSEQFHWQNDTLTITGFSPRIVQCDIDPLFIPEEHIPGFEALFTREEKRLSFNQMKLVMKVCRQKLQAQAIRAGILERAIRAAEKELSNLLNVNSLPHFTVRIVPEVHLHTRAELLADSTLSRKEMAHVLQRDSNAFSALRSGHANGPWEDLWQELDRARNTVPDLSDLGQWLEHSSSPHASDANRFEALGMEAEKDWGRFWETDAHKVPTRKKQAAIHSKNKPRPHRNFGFHPYYMGSAYTQYRFDLLWGVSYWGCKIDPTTGDAITQHGWDHTGLVEFARQRGTKVFLTVSNLGFEPNKAFFENKAAQEQLLSNIPDWLATRKADGVNIDFEEVPGSCREAFNDFLIRLSERLHRAGYLCTVCLYAVDFAHVFDIQKLSGKLDLFILMGYDYYYAGSKTTGPVAPLKKGPGLLPYTLEQSVESYLKEGLSADKLVLALPYYGRQWKTSGTSKPAPSDGFLNTFTYREIMKQKENEHASLQALSEVMVKESLVNGQQAQLWFDNAETLETKFRWAKEKGLAGVGMWALGYDGQYPELWDALERVFKPTSNEKT